MYQGIHKHISSLITHKHKGSNSCIPCPASFVFIYKYNTQTHTYHNGPFHPPTSPNQLNSMRMDHEELSNNLKKKRRERVSFSASLPEDIHGVFADSDCAVKYSSDPFHDIRKSIVKMIQYVKVQDWNDIEELIYCYIALNSPDVHIYITEAFLSLSTPRFTKRRN